MSQVIAARRLRLGQTYRVDAWWLQPLVVAIGLIIGFGYLTIAMFLPDYWHGPYLSPVGSPPIFGDSPHSWFGPAPSWWPRFLPWQMLILWGPLLFRLSCYYYRGSYYKAFFLSPPTCGVGTAHNEYSGERSIPLVLNNLHRYFFYIAAVFILFLSHDVYLATQFTDAATGHVEFGIGVGTPIMALNVVLIGCYTFGCHSFRHLVGGVVDALSGSPARLAAWKCASCLNGRHGLWAWLSLYSMCGTDLYIRLCNANVLSDVRLI